MFLFPADVSALKDIFQPRSQIRQSDNSYLKKRAFLSPSFSLCVLLTQEANDS